MWISIVTAILIIEIVILLPIVLSRAEKIIYAYFDTINKPLPAQPVSVEDIRKDIQNLEEDPEINEEVIEKGQRVKPKDKYIPTL